MIHIKKFYYILKYGRFTVIKSMLKNYRKYDNKDLFYLNWLMVIFSRMSFKILREHEKMGWFQEVQDRLSKIININDFVDLIEEIHNLGIFKNMKEELEIIRFMNMYLDIYVKFVNDSTKQNAKR